jgi:exonuclease III
MRIPASLSLVPLAVLAAVAACSSTGGIDPSTSDASTTADASDAGTGAPHTWLTRNVNLGFAVEPVIGASSIEQVPGLVAEAWARMEQNDFASRAALLADEVAQTSPDAIGLQEVALVKRTPASGATPIEYDYLVILQKALAAKGMKYVAVATQKDTDVTVPMFAGMDASGAPILDGVQIVDRDILLVREGLTTSRVESGRFKVGLPVSLGDSSLEVVRGWVSAVIETKDGSVRFVSTHLEDMVPEAQAAQANELLGLVAEEKLPVVLVGDFNAKPGTATPSLVTKAGFVDSWAQSNPNDPGFSCCQDVDLSKTLPFTERIDYVFVKNAASPDRIRGEVKGLLVGSDPKVRTPKGLWASDHAGYAASFPLPAR